MLAQSYLVNSTRPNSDGPRGYTSSGLSRAWGRMNLPLPKQAAQAAQAAQVAQSGPVQPVQPLRPVHPEGVDAQAEPGDESPAVADGRHGCNRCQAPVPRRGGMCRRCYDAVRRDAVAELAAEENRP